MLEIPNVTLVLFTILIAFILTFHLSCSKFMCFSHFYYSFAFLYIATTIYLYFFLAILVGFAKEICNTRGENQKGVSDISSTLQETKFYHSLIWLCVLISIVNNKKLYRWMTTFASRKSSLRDFIWYIYIYIYISISPKMSLLPFWFSPLEYVYFVISALFQLNIYIYILIYIGLNIHVS